VPYPQVIVASRLILAGRKGSMAGQFAPDDPANSIKKAIRSINPHSETQWVRGRGNVTYRPRRIRPHQNGRRWCKGGPRRNEGPISRAQKEKTNISATPHGEKRTLEISDELAEMPQTRKVTCSAHRLVRLSDGTPIRSWCVKSYRVRAFQLGERVKYHGDLLTRYV